MKHEDGPPASLKILEITYSNLLIARALYAFAKLGIADLLGDRTLSSEELAAAACVDRRALYRLLRTLTTADVVSESQDHRFSVFGSFQQAKGWGAKNQAATP